MQKKTIFFVGAALCLLVAIWAFYAYQKPRTTAAGQEADFKLSAKALYEAFAGNEQKANEQFANKIIQVSGDVEAIQQNGSNLTILLSAYEVSGGINCNMEQRENKKLATIGRGERITVKGRCTGFLMDVNLVDAVLVENK